MPPNPQVIDQCIQVFAIPELVVPWLDRFFDSPEIVLMDVMGKQALTADQISERWPKTESAEMPRKVAAFLERCIRRGVLNRLEDRTYALADFSTRYDIWAMFEGRMDVPESILQQINTLEMARYVRDTSDPITALKNDTPQDPSQRWPAYVLLPEADILIDRAEHIYLWPCNCRSMMKNCRKNVFTCVRFSNPRGLGWEISKSRAKAVIAKANQQGLMQSGEIAITPDGKISGAICNCCADCCFPLRLAERVGAHKRFPLQRCTARRIVKRCTLCGRCAKRCPFDAFTVSRGNTAVQAGIGADMATSAKKPTIDILLDSRLCHGCGLCAAGCPENAVEMIRLPGGKAPWEAEILA